MTPLIIAILFFAVGAVTYVVVPDKGQEIGRAVLWVGALLLGLALSGLHL